MVRSLPVRVAPYHRSGRIDHVEQVGRSPDPLPEKRNRTTDRPVRAERMAPTLRRSIHGSKAQPFHAQLLPGFNRLAMIVIEDEITLGGI